MAAEPSKKNENMTKSFDVMLTFSNVAAPAGSVLAILLTGEKKSAETLYAVRVSDTQVVASRAMIST